MVSGHAIECRINAEDPARNFMPSPGPVDAACRCPKGEGIRFDTMLYRGLPVPPFYDSLLGKLDRLGRGPRPRRWRGCAAALAGLEIDGLPTTVPLHQALADDPDVVAGPHSTRSFLEHWLETDVHRNPPSHKQGGRLMRARYSFGGDEHLFVEVSEEMSLEAFFKSLSISNGIRDAAINGVTEICPANASLPGQVRPGRDQARTIC